MKFAHVLEEALRVDEYPSSWVTAAISYRHLKKCIKDVQRELIALGLDAGTLRQQMIRYQYIFEGIDIDPKPRLQLKIENSGGRPVSASLSPETRSLFEKLTLAQSNTKNNSQSLALMDHEPDNHSECARIIEISVDTTYRPTSYETDIDKLSSDSKFFHLLGAELIRLQCLSSQEETKLNVAILGLGDVIQDVARPSHSLRVNDLYAWRRIFELYTDSQIFFSLNERTQHERTSASAQEQFQNFSERLTHLQQRFRRRESSSTLQQFMKLNQSLLQYLKFQELNVTAMTKILKKFDKRTALGAREKLPGVFAAETISPTTLAKSICFQISEKLISFIPQLSDYLCPVCFSISYKPIRLSIFCIRCLVIMQRSSQNSCPLCRGSVVMEADSANLDIDMLAFLKTYFPIEVKAKQRGNEEAAAIDKYGEAYNRKCSIM